MVTQEFGYFINFDTHYRTYSRWIWDRWWRTRNRQFDRRSRRKPGIVFHNSLLAFRYWLRIRQHRFHWIGIEAVSDGLRTIYPDARIIGDKYPDYVFSLDKLALIDELIRVVIFRDPRDVVASTLRKVRTDWGGRQFASKMNTAEKVAKRWLEAIELMERYKDRIFVMRYELLVTDPTRAIQGYADYLGVDAAGFPIEWVQGGMIGKYIDVLTEEEVDCVVEIAGPKMKELDYEL
jgi:hypothetical protein